MSSKPTNRRSSSSKTAPAGSPIKKGSGKNKGTTGQDEEWNELKGQLIRYSAVLALIICSAPLMTMLMYEPSKDFIRAL